MEIKITGIERFFEGLKRAQAAEQIASRSLVVENFAAQIVSGN